MDRDDVQAAEARLADMDLLDGDDNLIIDDPFESQVQDD